MAAIAIGDCTVTVEAALAGINMWKIVTPATADQADTIDVSTVMEAIIFGTAYNATDGTNLIVNTSTTSILLPSGGTDNEARTCYVLGHAVQSTGGAT